MMECKHETTKKLKIYGQEECLLCGVELDTADPNMLNKDGSPKKEAQEEWENEKPIIYLKSEDQLSEEFREKLRKLDLLF